MNETLACGYSSQSTWRDLFNEYQHDRTWIVSENLCIVLGIEDLCAKRDDLHKTILVEEEEKQKIQNDIRVLTERLAKVNESLSKKIASRNEFDKTIAETEGAYMKVGSNDNLGSCIKV